MQTDHYGCGSFYESSKGINVIPKKVLIVDDDKLCRMLSQFSFEQLGYSVEVCENPLSALARLEDENFDLLIIDQLMPEMTGFEVIKSIRKKGIEIPTYIISCLHEEDVLRTAKRCGVKLNGVLNKRDIDNSVTQAFKNE